MSWRRFFRRAQWDDERRRELESYVQLEADDQIARGMPADEARRRALLRLGNPTLVREDIYRMNTIGWLESVWKDIRYGLRLLRLNPGFALVALLSLSLGIGANAAIFQLLDAVRLRTLPVPHPEELVDVRITPNKSGRTGQFASRYPRLTRPLWDEIRRRQESFSEIFAWGASVFDLSTSGESRYVQGLWVSERYFAALGVTPLIGQLATVDDDERVCRSAPVVLSYAFWQREFGGDERVVGRTLSLDGHPFAIAGVTPRPFFGTEVGRGFDVALPLCTRAQLRPQPANLDDRMVWWLASFARLKPGWTAERATASLVAISPSLFEATVSPTYTVLDATNYQAFKLEAQPVPTGVSSLRTNYATPLMLLLGIAGLVLFIACANLATLMLARATAREREIAVRLALGASRRRIVRQLLAESLLLGGLGAALGVGIAQLLSRLLIAFLSSDGTAWMLDLAIDWRLVAFASGLAGLTVLLFGVTPALRATRTGPGPAMKAGGRGMTASRERFALRRTLVICQMAVSVVLLVGALLFVRTLANLASLNPGFRQHGILVANLDLRPANTPVDQQVALQRRMVDRLGGVPGVTSAASTSVVPISGSGWNQSIFIDGTRQDGYANASRVSPMYFRTMQMPIVLGREFDHRDTAASPTVAIVNESFVQKYLPGAPPIGRTFRIDAAPGAPDPAFEVVGVVRDTKYGDLRERVGPIMFFPDTQETDPTPYLSVMLATDGSPDALRQAVTRAAAEQVPGVLLSFQTFEEQIRDSLLRERLMATLSAGFAILAVLLAAVGLYGVMAYSVARRRNEIGIRVALGATRGRVLAMMVRETAWLIAAGAAAGLILAAIATRSATTLLFGLEPRDPATFSGAVIALALVAALATLIPARRATRLEPTTALREE